MCSFFVVLRNEQPLLGMSDNETQGILTINCNTIEKKEADGSENCKTNTGQEIDTAEKCYTNTDNISEFENEDKLTVTDNDNNNIKYFLPTSNKRVGLKSNSDYKRSWKLYLMV